MWRRRMCGRAVREGDASFAAIESLRGGSSS
jgi:hypothetical protein